ncbi:MAG: hypothetical protein AAGC47_11790 [Bacteroidota bacterium]
MKNLVPVFILFSFFGYSQNASSPFELERYANYDSVDLAKETAGQAEEVKLILEYHLEYKKQRAKSPNEYFPAPSERQKIISSALKTEYPSFWGNKLISFLEDGCTKENLEGLISTSNQNKLLLAYQFMAANALEKEDLEVKYLQGLLREGMISDVTKSWGITAISSASGFESILTNGMQDLIAVRYAQLIEKKGIEIDVDNKFVQGCALSETPLASMNAWFAPTLQKNVITPFKSRLQVAGIGFGFSAPSQGNSLKTVAGRIDESIAKSPADKGLVSSYTYLQKALEESGNAKEANELKEYISKQGQ